MRLNNKGFAISTMLYGLLIIAVLLIFMLLSIVAFNKKSNDDFVRQVEQELLTIKDNTKTCSETN